MQLQDQIQRMTKISIFASWVSFACASLVAMLYTRSASGERHRIQRQLEEKRKNRMGSQASQRRPSSRKVLDTWVNRQIRGLYESVGCKERLQTLDRGARTWIPTVLVRRPPSMIGVLKGVGSAIRVDRCKRGTSRWLP
eukprot:2215624-Amphidinium_carterae.1